MLGGEQSRVLECAVHCRSGVSAKTMHEWAGWGECSIPPTRVSWAPRRIALGSKFDMADGKAAVAFSSCAVTGVGV